MNITYLNRSQERPHIREMQCHHHCLRGRDFLSGSGLSLTRKESLPFDHIDLFLFETGTQSPDNDHGYKIALRLRQATGRPHYVVRTSDPLQPHRVTDHVPPRPDHTLAMIA